LLTLFILVLDPLQFIIKTYNNIITWWNARICLETISIANEPSGWLATHSMVATGWRRPTCPRRQPTSPGRRGSSSLETGLVKMEMKIEMLPENILFYLLIEYFNQWRLFQICKFSRKFLYKCLLKFISLPPCFKLILINLISCYK